MKILDFEVNTPQQVVARSASFLGRYLPVLALVLIAMWFIILIIVEAYDSDAGRVYALGVALASFAIALELLAAGFKTFPANSERAFMLFAAMGIISASGVVKSRLIMVILLGIGLVLGYLVYAPLLG